ncbi:unnamed protein product [Closterium sp. NIES-53]
MLRLRGDFVIHPELALPFLTGLCGASGGSGFCPYFICTGDRAGQTCGKLHTQHRCFYCFNDAWRAEFGDDVELPRWADLLRSRTAIFDLDFDAILSAMYALSNSAEGDCYRCVPPDLGIVAAALGVSESGTLPSTAPAHALHTFTLDSGASRYFFRVSTTLTPLPAPVPVRWLTPLGARSLPVPPLSSRVRRFRPAHCQVFTSLLFSTNLVSTAALQDAMVTTTTPGGQCVSICTCTWTGRNLATLTCRPGSSLYTLATKPPEVAASAQVSASGQVAASCSCRLLSHQTLLWHHHLGHPSLPRLRGMHSRLLISGLPRSLPPLPPSPAPPCLPCVEGRQCADSFPPTTAPLQTLHMDVWGPACVSRQSRERYFLLVFDDYTRYTTVFPLRSKSQVVDVLIPWIRTVRLQLLERFGQDLPVLRLHFDRGGDFSSNLLRDFCHGEGILQSFTLPDSPQQNGIAERRIGLVMEVSCTSMIHAAAPRFMWSFAVQYAAHQLNLWPRVSSPRLRWTGKVGDSSVFRVWVSRTFVRDPSTDKLSAGAIPCVFLGFVPDAPGWQFYHPTSRRVLPSQDVMFDKSVPFYCLFPYCSAPLPPLPLFVAPGPPLLFPLPPQGPAPSGVSQVNPPVDALDLGAARGTASGDAELGGAGPGGAELGGAETGGAEPGGVETGGAASEGADSGATRAGGAGVGGAGVAVGAGVTGGTAATGPGGARTRGLVVLGVLELETLRSMELLVLPALLLLALELEELELEALAQEALELEALAWEVLGTPSSSGLTPPLLCSPLDQSQPPLQPASPLRAPSTYTEQSGGLTQRREPASRPVSPVRTAHRVPHTRPPPIPSTHAMTLQSDRALGVSPNVSRLFATAVTDPSFESAAASALVAELLDFATACRLDYASALVAESASASPPSVGGECALGTDVLEDRQEDFQCLATAVPHFASMLLALVCVVV